MAALPTTRRGLLGGAASMIATVAACAAPTPAVAASVSPELAALIAAAEAAEAKARAFDDDVYEPARKRRDAAVEAVPHVTVSAGPNMEGRELIWSTANPVNVHMTDAIMRMYREGRGYTASVNAAARRLKAAHLWRERAIEAINRKANLRDLALQADSLSEASGDIQDAVAHFPAQTATDLHAKLAFMVKHEMGDGMDWLDELLADARTLAGEAAA